MEIRSLVKSPTTCRDRIQTIKDNVREYHRIYILDFGVMVTRKILVLESWVRLP